MAQQPGSQPGEEILQAGHFIQLRGPHDGLGFKAILVARIAEAGIAFVFGWKINHGHFLLA
jgi:hypothetical protein